MTLPTIPVTRHGTACPVSPCPATRGVERRIEHEWQRQARISLAKYAPALITKDATDD